MTGKEWVDLLKLPITIVFAALALVGACKWLGIEPTQIEVGDVKVDLTKQLRKDLFTNIDIEAIVKEEVKAQLDAIHAKPVAKKPNGNAELKEDVVSDNIAKLAKVVTDKGAENIYKSTEGYIWIGNFNHKIKAYCRQKINIDDLSQIKIGHDYFVNGNMVIRETSPVEHVNYFSGVKKIGLATKGVKVKVLEEPVRKEIGSYSQLWVKIRVEE
jgi:hypothetical protein